MSKNNRKFFSTSPIVVLVFLFCVSFPLNAQHKKGDVKLSLGFFVMDVPKEINNVTVQGISLPELRTKMSTVYTAGLAMDFFINEKWSISTLLAWPRKVKGPLEGGRYRITQELVNKFDFLTNYSSSLGIDIDQLVGQDIFQTQGDISLYGITLLGVRHFPIARKLDAHVGLSLTYLFIMGFNSNTFVENLEYIDYETKKLELKGVISPGVKAGLSYEITPKLDLDLIVSCTAQPLDLRIESDVAYGKIRLPIYTRISGTVPLWSYFLGLSYPIF